MDVVHQDALKLAWVRFERDRVNGEADAREDCERHRACLIQHPHWQSDGRDDHAEELAHLFLDALALFQ